MVISHTFRYLFIEIPLTGSWAIRNELCEFYDGHPILHKHATYHEFQRNATADEKTYLVFAAVRNPLDSMVSQYHKYRSNHKGIYSDAEQSIEANIIDYADAMHFESFRDSAPTFESAVLNRKLWQRPYTNMIDVSADHIDFVLRFERLSEDFSSVLERLGIQQTRPLAVTNKTKGRRADWASYYSNQAMISRVMQDCAPFMQRWGYDFPTAWGDVKISRTKRLEYRLTIIMKRIYLTRLRYSDSTIAMLARKANATLKRRVI